MQNTAISITDCNNFFALSPLDASPAEPSVENTPPDGGGAFNDYLKRAQSSSIDSNDDANNEEKDRGQPHPAQNENPDSVAIQSINDNDKDDVDKIDETDSGCNPNIPKSETQKSENVNENAEEDQAVSAVNDEEVTEKKKKVISNGQERLTVAVNVDDRPNPHVNQQNTDAKNHSLSVEKPSAAKEGVKDISNQTQIASKNTKTSADSDAVAKTDSLTANPPQTNASEHIDAPLSASVTEGVTKKTARDTQIKVEKLPMEQKAIATPSAREHNETTSVQTATDNSTSKHGHSRKSSHKTEKNTPSTTDAVESAVTQAGSQETAVSAQAIISPSLQTTINTQITRTNRPKDGIEHETGKTIFINKADDPTNVLQRLGQSTAKTSAGAPQGDRGEIFAHFDHARFVQRVERAFAAMGQRGGAVRLKLNPPELGSVRMEITVKKGMMTARLETETKETKNLLLENLPALRDRLAQQNIKIQNFDVDLRDPSAGGTPQQTTGQSDSGSRDSGSRAGSRRIHESAAAAETTTGTTLLNDHNGQLNVIV